MNRQSRFLQKGRFCLLSSLSILSLLLTMPSCNSQTHDDRDKDALQRVTPLMEQWLEPHGLHIGSPVFIRIIKEDLMLELWVKQDGSERFTLAKKYPIAAMSGKLGPKEREGDRQAPEGFYSVNASSLNPKSNYHLSFNVGYPNTYDQSLGRTGSFIMVHGSDVSIGCFAITDEGIEEVYTMVDQALKKGQKEVPVQIYPFVPTPARLAQEKDSPHYAFWKKLQSCWEETETTHQAAKPVF